MWPFGNARRVGVAMQQHAGVAPHASAERAFSLRLPASQMSSPSFGALWNVA